MLLTFVPSLRLVDSAQQLGHFDRSAMLAVCFVELCIHCAGDMPELAAEWVEEYVAGYSQEVYTIAVGHQFKGWYFHEMAAEVLHTLCTSSSDLDSHDSSSLLSKS